MLRPAEYREVLRLLTGIDPDGVDDTRDLHVIEGVCLAQEAFGPRMHVQDRELIVLRRHYEAQEPSFYDDE